MQTNLYLLIRTSKLSICQWHPIRPFRSVSCRKFFGLLIKLKGRWKFAISLLVFLSVGLSLLYRRFGIYRENQNRSWCQSENRAVADVVAAGDLAHGLAVFVAPADRLALLIVGQFRFAAELDAARLGACASFPGAGAD